MMRPVLGALALTLLAGCASTGPVAFEGAELDRSKMPEAGPERPFAPPPIQRATLSNGLTVLVAENHELPITGLSLVVRSGTAVDPKGKEGVASLTAELLVRGTSDMDALTIDDAMKNVGANFGSGSSLDASFLSLVTLNKHLDTTLKIFAQSALGPALPAEELERVRQQTLTSIVQQQDNPSFMASKLFNSLLYGDVYHGRLGDGTAESVASITRDDLVAYYDKWYHPGNSVLIVAGDIDMKTLVPQLEGVFGAWPAVEVKTPAVKLPAAPEKTVLYLLDKPGAAQSQLRVGTTGIARKDSRFYAVQVMNQELGGSFQSRINLNLREDKGYTYGARSSFRTSVAPGPFLVGTGVRTDVTAESINEIMKELRDIQGDKPISAEQLLYQQDALARQFPGAFEATSDLLGVLRVLAVSDLPDDTFTRYVSEIRSQTLETVADAASIIDVNKLVIVVVGDRATVEQPLRDAGYEVVVVDGDGNPLATP